MFKFKIGDRVRNLEQDGFLDIGDTGTVKETDDVPRVLWDGKRWDLNFLRGGTYAQHEDSMELIKSDGE